VIVSLLNILTCRLNHRDQPQIMPFDEIMTSSGVTSSRLILGGMAWWHRLWSFGRKYCQLVKSSISDSPVLQTALLMAVRSRRWQSIVSFVLRSATVIGGTKSENNWSWSSRPPDKSHWFSLPLALYLYLCSSLSVIFRFYLSVYIRTWTDATPSIYPCSAIKLRRLVSLF